MTPLNLGWLTKNLGNIVAPENPSETESRFAKSDSEKQIDTAEPLPLTPVCHSSMHTQVHTGFLCLLLAYSLRFPCYIYMHS